MPVNAEQTAAFANLTKSFISADDTRDRLGAALRLHLDVAPKDYFWICDHGATEEGPVAIYNLERGSDGDSPMKAIPIGPGEYFRIPFKLEAGVYTFGEPVKVRRKTDYEVVPTPVQKSQTAGAQAAAPARVPPLVARRLGASLTDEERAFAKSLQASHLAAAERQPDAGAKAAHAEAAGHFDGASRTLDTPEYRRELAKGGTVAGLIKAWSNIPDGQRLPFADFRKSMEQPTSARLGDLGFRPSNGTGDALGCLSKAFAAARPVVEQPASVAPEASTYSAQRGAVNGMRKSMGAFYDRLSSGAARTPFEGRFPPEAKGPTPAAQPDRI